MTPRCSCAQSSKPHAGELAQPLLNSRKSLDYPGFCAVFGHSIPRKLQNELRETGMRQSTTRELFNYWNNLRGERTSPDRAEIDPAAIRGVLAETFMLEVDPEHLFPVRLSGSRINALFCTEQKRHSFVGLWSQSEAASIAAILSTVAESACPVVAGAAAAPKGYAEVEVELLFLPLRHGGDVNARILGSLSLIRRPPWLGLLPVEHLALRSLRTIGDNVAPLTSEPISGALPQAQTAPGLGYETRGHLRIYPGGR